MSNGIKSMMGGAVKNVGEAVVKPAINELGKDAEEGVNSVFGTPQNQTSQTNQQTPQQLQSQNLRKQEDENKKRNLQMFFQKLTEGQQREVGIRRSEDEKKKKEDKEKQEKKEVKQFEIIQNEKKQEDVTIAQKQRRTEIRKGSR